MALPFPPGVKDFVKTEHHDTYPAIFPQRANLKGRSVLITGASRGIGRALAISYGIAGASHIAITARNHIPEIVQEVKAAAVSYERAEPQVVSIKLDVTSKESVDACRKKVEEAFGGKLDIVVANHGMLAAFVPIPESDPDIWWQQYEVNVKGTYLVARAFIPLLQKAGSLGNFVVQSSVGAREFFLFGVLRLVGIDTRANNIHRPLDTRWNGIPEWQARTCSHDRGYHHREPHRGQARKGGDSCLRVRGASGCG